MCSHLLPHVPLRISPGLPARDDFRAPFTHGFGEGRLTTLLGRSAPDLGTAAQRHPETSPIARRHAGIRL